MKSAFLRIGELAARAGVSIDTVRFYERRGLLPTAPRTEGGFRLFAPEMVGRVRFIRQAQELGFSLNEIGQLLFTDAGADECRRVRDLLRAKLAEVDARLSAMQQFRHTLADHLAACERELAAHGPAAECPVMVEISQVSRSSEAATRKEKRNGPHHRRQA